MAKLPRNVKGDLRAINSGLGDIVTKLDNISRMDNILKIDVGELEDAAGQLDKIAQLNKSWASQLEKVLKVSKDLKKQLEGARKEEDKLQKQAQESLKDFKEGKKGWEDHQKIVKDVNKLLTKQRDIVQDLVKKTDQLPGKWKIVSKLVGQQLFAAFDKLGKGILTLGLDTLQFGLVKLEDSVEAVYELSERWAKAMGTLNMRLGALSPNMAGINKRAGEWEGTVRGLTDQFGEGLELFQEFQGGFTRLLPDAEAKKWDRLGVEVARGLGLGGAAAGEFLKAMYQLGQSTEDATKFFGDVVGAARTAGVSTNELAKDLAEARGFVVSFGKEGQRAFVTSAAWAKKLGVSLKSLEQFTRATDTFESTAQAVARLNTVFGTTINSLDLMLEQDPGKRLETIRSALIGQGKTFANLSRQERQLIAETLNLSEEEVAGVLKNGESLEDFQKRQGAERQREADDQKLLKHALAATATTLFAFGKSWDTVTRHVEQLIAPFTKMLGLTAELDAKGHRINATFGEKMSKIFGVLTKTIDRIGSNTDFVAFMKEAAADAAKLGKSFTDYLASPEFVKDLRSVVAAAKDFYGILKSAFKFLVAGAGPIKSVLGFILDHMTAILAAWAAVKGATLAGGLFSAGKAVFGAAGAAGAMGGGAGTVGGASGVGRALEGVAGAASSLKGGIEALEKSLGSGVGGALGKAGLLGAVFGTSYALTRLISSATGFDEVMVGLFEKMGRAKDWLGEKFSKLGSTGAERLGSHGLGTRNTAAVGDLLQKFKEHRATSANIDYLRSLSSAGLSDDLAESLGGRFGGKAIAADLLAQATSSGAKMRMSTAAIPPSPTAVGGTAAAGPKNMAKTAAKAAAADANGAGNIYLDGQQVGKIIGPYVARPMVRELAAGEY